MYLLAKKLPHTLVSDQNDEFKKLLAQTEAKDIVAFAQAVGQQATEIDGKVCKGKSSENKGHANANKKYVCGKEGAGSTHNGPGLVEFGKALAGGKDHWPKTTDGVDEPNKDNAGQVAVGLSGLPHGERTKVAGLLSKTISGAEVVEIRAVSKFAKSSPNEKRSRLQKQQYNNF